MKVVIIDDNEIIRNLLSDLLKGRGYETFLASDGSEGLQMIEDIKPQFALVDLVLPDMSGIWVLRSIRKLSPLTEPIVITGHASVDNIKQVLETNAASGYLEKPIAFDNLVSVLSEITTRRRDAFVIQETLEEVKAEKNQVEFFNSIFKQDFRLFAKYMKKALDYLRSDDLTPEQVKGLDIVESLFKGNIRLGYVLAKLREIEELEADSFAPVDLVSVLNNTFNRMSADFDDTYLPVEIENSLDKYYVVGLFDELCDMFYELFYSLIKPVMRLKPDVNYNLKESTSITTTDGQPIPTIEVEVLVSYIRSKLEHVPQLSEIESQNYGLGFYIVRKLIGIFKGQIYLEDKKQEDVIITRLVVYLPLHNK